MDRAKEIVSEYYLDSDMLIEERLPYKEQKIR